MDIPNRMDIPDQSPFFKGKVCPGTCFSQYMQMQDWLLVFGCVLKAVTALHRHIAINTYASLCTHIHAYAYIGIDLQACAYRATRGEEG